MLSVIASVIVIVAIYIFYYFYTKSTQTLANTQAQMVENAKIADNAKKDLEAAVIRLAVSKDAEDAANKIAEGALKNERDAVQNAKNALEKKELADKAVSEAQTQLKIADTVTQKQIAELNLVKLQQQQTEANYNATVSELEKNKQIQASLNANLNICNTSQDTLKNIINKHEADLQLLNSVIMQNKTIIDKQLIDIKTENDNYNKQKELCAQLQQNVNDSAANLLAKNKELTELQNKYNILNGTINNSPEYIAKNTELTTLKTDYQAKLTELTTLKADYQAKLTELNTLKSDYQAKLTELNNSKQDLVTITDTLNALKITYQDKVNEFNILLDKYNKISNDFNTQKNTIDDQLKIINAMKEFMANGNYILKKDIDYVRGYFGDAHVNEDLGIDGIRTGRSPEYCRNKAKELQYKAWGHRNHTHGSPEWRNTCFFYSDYPAAITPGSEGIGAGEHLTGCINPGDKLEYGCRAAPTPVALVQEQKSAVVAQVQVQEQKIAAVGDLDMVVGKYYLYGPYIGSEVPVQKISPAINDNIYMVYNDGYTKMVNDKGDAKYYQGELSAFNRANWNSYTDAGVGNYKLKKEIQIEYIGGYFGDKHTNEELNVPDRNKRSPEDCRRIAADPKYKYKAWGHRNTLHDSPEWRNTCFFYPDYPDAITTEGIRAGEHLTGCINPGDRLIDGCKPPSAPAWSSWWSFGSSAAAAPVEPAPAPLTKINMNLAEGIQKIEGYFGNGHINEDLNVQGRNLRSPEACRIIAANPKYKYKAWGHRNDTHGSPEWRNTCFFYPDYPASITSKGDGAGEHLTGCLNPGDRLQDGCKPIYKNRTWSKVESPNLTQVSIDKNVVCGVGEGDIVYCRDNLTSGNWNEVPGRLKHISVSNGKLYGVNSKDEIFYADNYKDARWTQIAGGLKQVEIDGNVVCGVNSENKIYCKDDDDLKSANWFDVPGGLKHISLSNGKLYGVDNNNTIYYADNYKDAKWKIIEGKLKQVDISGNVACGIAPEGYGIYCKNDLDSNNWEELQGKLTSVSVSDGNLYGVAHDKSIWSNLL